MSYDRVKSTLPKVPLLLPVTSKHRTIDPHDPHTTAPECKARLRHTLACNASLRKCTMRRETFISIHICRSTLSCCQSSFHKPRFQRPENSHLTQVHNFGEQYAGQEHVCKTLATSNSSTAAIPEPTNSCCIRAVQVHLVLSFLDQTSRFVFRPCIGFFTVLKKDVNRPIVLLFLNLVVMVSHSLHLLLDIPNRCPRTLPCLALPCL